MDLNQKGMYFPRTREVISTDYFRDGDTTLRLDCLGHGGSNKAGNGGTTDLGVFGSNPSDDGCRLVLGLGPTSKSIYYEAKQSKESPSSIALQGFSNDSDSSLKLGLSRGSGTLFGSAEFSVSGRCDPSVHCHRGHELLAGHRKGFSFPIVVDEGSTSAKQSAGGYMPSLLLAPRMMGSYQDSVMPAGDTSELVTKPRYCEHSQLSSEPSTPSTYTVGSLGGTASDPSPTATSAGHRHHNAKKCQFLGCTKGARGASGFCIGHGGGQRCQKPGCNKGAESRTAYCKAHGGGRRCQHLGCTKSAEGKTDFCIAHGGGRRCQHSTGCTKAARGKSGLCIRHGGGKRCKVEGCTRSAEGQAGLCISHGGGRRCQFIGCTKGAQGSTLFCKAHGGGKRCIFAGCTKGAEGSTPLCKGHGGGKRCLFDGGGICPKSVHGGTNYCVAHGGGKRCAVAGCTKSARGRTDFCVRHGGGKRCKVENCGKSAQGSTDFCKAHGGGKRCSWGEGKCEKFARGRSGLCASHSNMLQDRQINKRSMIASGLFHGLVSAASPAESGYNDNSSSGASVVSDCTEFGERPNKRQHLLPPQVLVPMSMKSSLSYASTDMPDQGTNDANRAGRSSFDFVIPEGRVHGGGLMSLLGGSLKNPVNRLDQ